MAASKSDLMGNAAHWLKEAKRNHLGDAGVGAIFIFFNTNEFGSAVCAATVNKAYLKKHLKAIIDKIEQDETRIVTPYDN